VNAERDPRCTESGDIQYTGSLVSHLFIAHPKPTKYMKQEKQKKTENRVLKNKIKTKIKIDKPAES
jgi:hypothetical protein